MQITHISNRNIAFNFKGHQIIFCAANNNIQYLAKDLADEKTMTRNRDKPLTLGRGRIAVEEFQPNAVYLVARCIVLKLQ